MLNFVFHAKFIYNIHINQYLCASFILASQPFRIKSNSFPMKYILQEEFLV